MIIAPQRLPSPVYAFGSFRMDPMRRLLFHSDEVVPLPERLAQLLLLLIQANGAIVEKHAIAQTVWPDSLVSEGNLTQHMYMLRQLLEERARDRSYVVTVRGKGYRFAAPVSVLSPDGNDAAPETMQSSPDALLRSGLEVFHHYSRGCYLVEKCSARDMRDAAEHFEAALRIDPNYAPALIGLATAYTRLATYWYVPGAYAFPKAKGAVMRALAMNSSSASAHAMLSLILAFCDWDWREAERENATALRLNPNSTFVRNNAAWLAICQGATDLAVAQAQHALALEPHSPQLQLLLARMLLHAGDYRVAIDSLSNLIESGPEFVLARRYRAQAYLLNGEPAEALGDLLLLPQDRAEDIALRLPLLGRAYADCGDSERAKEIYDTLSDLAHTEFVADWNLAVVAIGLGRFDEALDHLERALAQREPSLPMLRTLKWFVPISGRARFKSILSSIRC